MCFMSFFVFLGCCCYGQMKSLVNEITYVEEVLLPCISWLFFGRGMLNHASGIYLIKYEKRVPLTGVKHSKESRRIVSNN